MRGATAPYPDPKYWMQYPLPTCCILDDLKFCDHYRKSGCIDTYLIEHPTPTGKKKQKKDREAQRKSDRTREIPAKRESATVLVPPGFVFVDVVLPAQKAFIARKWAEQARANIEAVAKSGKSSAKGKD